MYKFIKNLILSLIPMSIAFGLTACGGSTDEAGLTLSSDSLASDPAGEAQADEEIPARNTGGLFGSADNPPSIWSASSTVARTPFRNEWVNIPLESGDDLKSWVVYPDTDAPAPVVIVLQYEGGLDDWQRGIAYQLAYHGYIAVAPDLFSGFGPDGGGFDAFRTPSEAVRTGSELLTSRQALNRAQAAVEYGVNLPEANGGLATIGFGSGGDLSFRLAAETPSIDAAIVFYGLAPEVDTMAGIEAPVIGFYGDDDPRTATVDSTAALMEQLGKTYEYHVYEGATRDFMVAQFEGVNTPATEDAWSRTITFLQQYL